MKVADAEFCGDMGADGATCVHFLSTDTRDIEKAAWDAERVGMLCTSSTNFANWKTAIEQLCHETKDCDFQTKVAVATFFRKVELVQARRSVRQ